MMMLISTMKPTSSPTAKRTKTIQPTLFGIKNYRITPKITKDVGGNQRKVVSEFVRVESQKSVENGGVFGFSCEHCSKEFKTNQALGGHKAHCLAAKEAAKLLPNLTKTSSILIHATDEYICISCHERYNVGGI